jgi:hypothetical protein
VFDSAAETYQQFKRRRRREKLAHDSLFGWKYLKLDELAMHLILNHIHIDCFVSQCRDNESVEEVAFNPYACHDQDQDDGFWGKIGQAIGNLQKLKRFHDEGEDEDLPIPDWEVLARILSHVRQRITLHVFCVPPWDLEVSRSFAGAIHGHPTITRFESRFNFPYESLDA